MQWSARKNCKRVKTFSRLESINLFTIDLVFVVDIVLAVLSRRQLIQQ